MITRDEDLIAAAEAAADQLPPISDDQAARAARVLATVHDTEQAAS